MKTITITYLNKKEVIFFVVDLRINEREIIIKTDHENIITITLDYIAKILIE